MPIQHLSASLSQAQIDEIKSKVSDIMNILSFGVNLTPKERKDARKMGPKSVFYVDLGLSVARNHPEAIPAGFKTSQFQESVSLSKALEEVFVVLAPLNEMVDDTRLLIGIECMKFADTIYNAVKISKNSDEKLDNLRLQLAERFKNIGTNRGKGKRKKKKAPQK
jgi:hypothetical protein